VDLRARRARGGGWRRHPLSAAIAVEARNSPLVATSRLSAVTKRKRGQEPERSELSAAGISPSQKGHGKSGPSEPCGGTTRSVTGSWPDRSAPTSAMPELPIIIRELRFARIGRFRTPLDASLGCLVIFAGLFERFVLAAKGPHVVRQPRFFGAHGAIRRNAVKNGRIHLL
jgi:hypothetical protein